MAALKILLYLILSIAVVLTYCDDGNDENEERWVNDIPERCTNNSVTPVSCRDVHTIGNLVPHPDDCQLFYYCVTPDHPPICRQCPAQLHFNPHLLLCDHPIYAGCTAPIQ